MNRMAKRVKVAHIITRLELGGAQQNTLYCCANHDREKFEIVLISGVGGYLDAEAKKIKNCKTYFLYELKHAIYPWWDFAAFWKLAAILKQEQIQIVHTHSSKAGFLGRWAARLAGVPCIVHTVHGWGFFKDQFFLTRFLYQTLERWTAPITDTMIVVSRDNEIEGLFHEIGRKKQYSVIHSGIIPQNYVLSSTNARKARHMFNPQNRPCVLVLSNFKKQKSPLDVVETAKKLVLKVPSVLFLWAGDGPLMPRVKEAIEQEGLSKYFKLLGWREDVAELLAASDVMFLASLHEGLPRVVLQTMAAGKPVVATAVNGTPEAVQQGVTGYLTRPHATNKMAETLAKILMNKTLARKMGKAGQKSLKGTFLMDKMLLEIEKLYGALIARKS
jgi:glycosyltransferase involved in cell wall biosynthesis